VLVFEEKVQFFLVGEKKRKHRQGVQMKKVEKIKVEHICLLTYQKIDFDEMNLMVQEFQLDAAEIEG
jgi:hypothetical protein